jgi:group II intron reverse transcriptase/maturase
MLRGRSQRQYVVCNGNIIRTSRIGGIMQTTMQGITNKAKLKPEHRFRDLYRILNEESLREAFHRLKKGKAAGVDKITVEEYEKDLDGNIAEVVEQLKKKSYKAKLVRRTYIPKGKGKKRPLGIPATSDKMVQTAVAEILTAIYEEDFYPNSYGYRRGIGAIDAIKALSRELQYGRYNYIVEADIKGFFDNMQHDWIVKMLEVRVDDRAFIRVIKKWLKAGILEEDGKVIHPTTGTPQGGIVSPVLANIYLHYAMDNWFEKVVKKKCKGEVYLCRYADDFVCAFQYRSDAEKFYKALGMRLNKFALEVAAEKTKIIQFSRNNDKGNGKFEFLGFEFRWGRTRNGKMGVKKRTSPKKLRKSITNFTNWCRKFGSMSKSQIFKKLNAKLRGYYNYYGIIGNYKSLSKFFYAAMKILFKWLKRKSFKRRLNWEKFNMYLEVFKVEKPKIVHVYY